MTNELYFIFKTEDMRKLVEESSDFVVVRSFLEAVVLKDGTKAGALRVYADAVKKKKRKPLATIVGCPQPPCSIDG